jgi:hypothetical protein
LRYALTELRQPTVHSLARREAHAAHLSIVVLPFGLNGREHRCALAELFGEIEQSHLGELLLTARPNRTKKQPAAFGGGL